MNEQTNESSWVHLGTAIGPIEFGFEKEGSFVENFDSELKSMILKWLRRGYSPMCIQDALEATGRLFDRLPDAQDYIEAIKDGNELNAKITNQPVVD